jgi:hypothetical protein
MKRIHAAPKLAAPVSRAANRENIVLRNLKILALLMPLIAACASPQTPVTAAAVPANLKPAANASLAMIVPAKGVQIYECRAARDKAGYEWAFVAPEADLFDANGKKIGRHYAGPVWESADGSKVAGSLKARADAAAAGAIPWLLLDAKSIGMQGAFSGVASIQRLNTAGGVAPKDGCTQADAGKAARVGYTADYYFFNRY